MSGLLQRALSAAVITPLLALFIWRSAPIAFAALVSLVIVLASMEWFAMSATPDMARWCALPLLAALPPGLARLGDRFWGPYLALVLAAVAAVSVFGRGSPRERLAVAHNLAHGFIFIALPLSFMALLRTVEGGIRAIFFLLLCLWFSDTAAYLIGVRLGRRPMAPVLSPKKTMEGLAAALAVGAMAGAFLGPALLDLSLMPAALLGFVLAGLGQWGDLFESLWKRAMGAKDSGSIIPGHGGVLDRIDSFFLTTPALYYLLEILRS